MDYSAAHRDAFDRLDPYFRGLSEGELEATVPACPHWSVFDIACHLTGLAVDCSGESLPSAADWEEEVMDRRHVDARRGMGLGEVLAEWKRAAPGMEQTLGKLDPRMAGAIAGEYACHEHDVRGALGQPGARASFCTSAATQAYVGALVGRVEAGGLPPLVVRAGDRSWGTEDASDPTVVAGEPFEIFRAVTGRRTAEQIRALDWQGDPGPYLAVFSMYSLPAEALRE